MGYVAVTGLNLPPDDTRYEAGEDVPAAAVEQWMIEQGLVIDTDAKRETQTIADTEVASLEEVLAQTASTGTPFPASPKEH